MSEKGGSHSITIGDISKLKIVESTGAKNESLFALYL
jgi:hypothetical protein